MSNTQISPALPSDAPVLTSIAFASKRYWGYPEEWIQRWTADLTFLPEYIRQHFLFKLVLESQIIGCCAIEKTPSGFEITHLWVLPEFIGLGYGKQLLDYSLKTVTPKESLIRVEADPNAAKWYERQGFVVVEQVESWPPGRFLPLMELQYYNKPD